MAMGRRTILQAATPPDSRPRWIFIPTDGWDDSKKDRTVGFYYVLLVVLLLLLLFLMFYYIRRCSKKNHHDHDHNHDQPQQQQAQPRCDQIGRWISGLRFDCSSTTTTTNARTTTEQPNDNQQQQQQQQQQQSCWDGIRRLTSGLRFEGKSTMNARTTFRYSPKGDQPSDCVICLLVLKRRQKVRILKRCGHVFHGKCIDTWFTESLTCTCPVCRDSAL